MKYGPEGDEAQLAQKIDELFDFDKQSHEDLQNAIADVEQEQLNLNQARMNMGEEKKSVTEPLVQKMDNFHGKCDDSTNELKHRLHELQEKRCGEYEAKLEELGQKFNALKEETIKEMADAKPATKPEMEKQIETIEDKELSVSHQLQDTIREMETVIAQIRKVKQEMSEPMQSY